MEEDKTPKQQSSGSGDNGSLVLTSGNNKKLMVFGNPEKPLRPFQVDGLQWLWGLHCQGVEGGILGDDMGLGKTLQIVVFINSLFHGNLIRSVLVVVPPTLLDTWKDEFAQVGRTVHIFHGKHKPLKDEGIVVTTYDTLVYNRASLSRGWSYIVLDEGHLISNSKTHRSKTLHDMSAVHRLVVTGTPLQNTIDELFCLLRFCLPNKFNDIDEFRKTRINPIVIGKKTNANFHEYHCGQVAIEGLRTDLDPYLLRRSKHEVLLDLPKKHEFTLWLKLSSKQRTLYEKFVKAEIMAIKRTPLSAISMLKKVCDDPHLLLNLDEESNEEEFKDHGASVFLASRMNKLMKQLTRKNKDFECCKMEFLVSFVDDMCKEDHNVLIFSQRKHMLNIIQKEFEKKGIQCGRLDGDCSSKARTTTIKNFESNNLKILVIMSKVGGVGITLKRADRVIIVDPAWNPSTDDQSVCRAYRMGQQREVRVYRLITSGTVEENIYKNQVYKVMLAKLVVDGKNPLSYFSNEEMKQMFTMTEGGFDRSATEVQLAREHVVTDPSIKAHMEDIINGSEQIVGVTYHSLLFSQVEEEAELRDPHVFTPQDVVTHRQMHTRQKEVMEEKFVRVPLKSFSPIFGKENIKSIEEQSRAKIQVMRFGGGSARTMKITGFSRQINKADQIIQDKVKLHNRQLTFSSGGSRSNPSQDAFSSGGSLSNHSRRHAAYVEYPRRNDSPLHLDTSRCRDKNLINQSWSNRGGSGDRDRGIGTLRSDFEGKSGYKPPYESQSQNPSAHGSRDTNKTYGKPPHESGISDEKNDKSNDKWDTPQMNYRSVLQDPQESQSSTAHGSMSRLPSNEHLKVQGELVEDSKFKRTLTCYVKDYLDETQNIRREVRESIVKAVVDKIITSMQNTPYGIPTTQGGINAVFSRDKSNIIKLVEDYVKRLSKKPA